MSPVRSSGIQDSNTSPGTRLSVTLNSGCASSDNCAKTWDSPTVSGTRGYQWERGTVASLVRPFTSMRADA